MVDEGVDGGGVGGVLGVRGGRVAAPVGLRRDRLGGAHPDGLDVGGVVARGAADVGVLADLGLGEELLARRPAHRTGRRLDDDVLEAEPVEDPDVGVAVLLVGLLEPGVVDVEGVGVLHHELAPAQQPGARTRLVAVLGLDLVDRERQVLVGGVEVLHHEGEHLLVRGAEEVVGALAVLEPEDVGAVVGPAVGRLVGLLGQQRGERQLLGADVVHLLADDGLDPAQHAQAQGQPGVHARRDAADVAGADQQAVARDLGVVGVVAQGAHEQGRHAEEAASHGRKDRCAPRGTAHQIRRCLDCRLLHRANPEGPSRARAPRDRLHLRLHPLRRRDDHGQPGPHLRRRDRPRAGRLPARGGPQRRRLDHPGAEGGAGRAPPAQDRPGRQGAGGQPGRLRRRVDEPGDRVRPRDREAGRSPIPTDRCPAARAAGVALSRRSGGREPPHVRTESNR